MKKITIHDVAKEAGVSSATVSRAICGSKEIGEKTREQVLRICRDLGYSSNYQSPVTHSTQTGVVGLILPAVNDPSMGALTVALEQQLRTQGYSLLIGNSYGDPKQEKTLFDRMLAQRVEGIFLVPGSTGTRNNLAQQLEKVQTVFLNENLMEQPESYVTTDFRRGATLGVEYLLSLGHRKILLLGGNSENSSLQLLTEGFTTACKKYEIKADYCENPSREASIEAGYHLARHLFRKPVHWTAIFTTSDLLAIGALQAAKEAGVSAPQDISLLGFGDYAFSSLPQISLTTLALPLQPMVTAAVDVMMEMLHAEADGYSHRIYAPRLVERSTCGKKKQI